MKLIPNRLQFLIDEVIDPQKASFIIVPIPYEHTTSYGKGTKNGPKSILKSSYQLELWDEEIKKDIYKVGIFTADYFNHIKSEKVFFREIGRFVDDLISIYRGIPIFIGGEHSITQGLVPSFEKKYENLSILHFDAHADLRDEYEGNPHSHASALYPASLRSKIVQIGIRSVATEEKHLINTGNVKTFLMHECLDVDKLIEDVVEELSNNVYLTIDVDGFDPSVMPATGTPQPGGFSWYDALKIFKAVCMNKNIVGFDIVEVSPIKGSNITEFNSAKLIYRLIGYISLRKGLL
ncbi:MAG: agmatinase [Elusimicrobiales bacterium]|nr:agmatinase [Elusimicrobiales bacterium]